MSIILLAPPALALSQQIETQITADSVIVNSEGILKAEGNLVVQHGIVKVKAEALFFNRKDNSIKFNKIREFYDGKAIVFSASEADINGELSDGIIKLLGSYLMKR